MKRIILLILLALTCISCEKKSNNSVTPEVTTTTDSNAVEMCITDMDDAVVMVKITNNTAKEIQTSEYYWIERYVSGGWETVNLEHLVNDVLVLIEGGSSKTIEIELYRDQFEYPKGQYRILKKIKMDGVETDFYVEFSLE